AERVIELWRKERLTDKQKKELADLQERARQRDQEFAALQSKANRTEQEQERFVLLKETRDNRQRQLRELERQYALEIQEADKQLNAKDREATMKVREIVAEVAKKLGLELVFEADRVLYGGLDITTQVIERLNQEPYAVFEPGE
ncbi:MAG: OmpH family outer membrane protein, partial [Armatimonadota bacterium]